MTAATRSLLLRVPDDIAKRLKEAASNEERSANKMALIFIKEGLARREENNKEAR